MLCSNCFKDIPDDSVYCTNCGAKIIEDVSVVPLNNSLCSNCGHPINNEDKFCTNCGSHIHVSNTVQIQNARDLLNKSDLSLQKAQLKLQAMSLQAQQEQLELQQKQYESMTRCPHCGSTSLSGNKKGFGIGKAVVGAWALGPIGLVAGNIGAKKLIVTCLNCGKRFKL